MSCVVIYIPKEADFDHILVVDQAPHLIGDAYIGDVAWGPIRKFSREDFERQGDRVVLESLAAFPGRISGERGEFDLLSAGARNRIERKCDDFLISPVEDVTLRVGCFTTKQFELVAVEKLSGARLVKVCATLRAIGPAPTI